MADGDLCTVNQVKKEGQIRTDSYDEDIAYKISDLSEYVKGPDVTNNPDLTGSDRNARMACIYGVLEWLEQTNVNINSQNVSSIKEGDKTVSYGNKTSSNTSSSSPRNYTEKYNHYLSLLMGESNDVVEEKYTRRNTSMDWYDNR